jgi:aryl-alcohol dehydrogenase-like predicted oxidoreductase
MGSPLFGLGGLHRLPFHSGRIRLLNAALDLGFRDFDVAPAYGNGLNELELGRALTGARYDCRITTKFGIPVDLYGERHPHLFYVLRAAKKLVDQNYGSEYQRRFFSPEEMQKSLEESLRRLRRDYVDDFMIHEPLVPFRREDIGALNDKAARLRQQGKIRRWGVAGPVSSMGALTADSSIDVIQFPLDDLTATSGLQGKRRIAFGVYRRYKKAASEREFPHFVRDLIDGHKGLDVIVSTVSLATLRGFGKLF